MSDFTDFTASLADWANRADWSPALLTSFVRNAEEKLNSELRIDRMILTAINTVTSGCAGLPDNWLESDFMQIAAPTPTGWAPVEYKPRAEFFRLGSANCTIGYYTIEGRTLFFGGPPDSVEGVSFKMNYYAEVPVFSDTQNSWVYTKFQSLYRCAALMHADLHAVGEEDKAAQQKQLAEDMINKLNMAHRYARASGSRLSRGHRRSFG